MYKEYLFSLIGSAKEGESRFMQIKYGLMDPSGAGAWKGKRREKKRNEANEERKEMQQMRK